ncbi:MAG: cysteine-rich repeat protein, partial [Bradymonadia bacterium]
MKTASKILIISGLGLAVVASDTAHAECGDDIIDTVDGEECDDGGIDPYDGCGATCLIEACGDEEVFVGVTPELTLCGSIDEDGAPECGFENGPNANEESFTFVAPGTGLYSFSTFTGIEVEGGEELFDTVLYLRDTCFDASFIDCNDDAFVTVPPFETLFSILSDIELSRAQEIIVYVSEFSRGTDFCAEYDLTIGGRWCGDSTVDEDLDELCDDGNVANDDGCSEFCLLEFCGDETTNGDEECDAGSLLSESCDTDCTFPECGDGLLNLLAGEACDAGEETETCDTDCTLALCGDGLLNELAGEECDDGNTDPYDGCGVSCLLDICPGETAVLGIQLGNSCDRDSDPSPCGGATEGTPEMSYEFVAPGDGLYDFDTVREDGFDSERDYDTVLYLRSECGAEADIICNDDVGIEESVFSEILAVPLAAGESIIVYVAGFSGRCGDFELEINGNFCGDGTLDSDSRGEECDDGNVIDGDGCNSRCFIEFCGDETTNGEEECDAGGLETDFCDLDCTFPECGDAVLNTTAGEDCDEGGVTGTCNADCTEPRCGNESIEDLAGEECDDGGTANGDGCDELCQLEPVCGDGEVEAPEECDDSNTDNDDGCNEFCFLEFCGDGIVSGDEECDLQGAETDVCDSDCTLPECGDGLLNLSAGELCDTAGASDTCRADCTPVVCGDGVLDDLAGEECDDGNTDNDDGCNDSCELEPACGDG